MFCMEGPYTFACPFLSFVSTLKLPNNSCLQVLVESYDRFLEFVQRSKVVSPIFALETATALQVIVSISWYGALLLEN